MGIAFINSVGNLAGFAIPLVIGMIKDRTHSTDTGLHMLAVLMMLGAIAVLSLRKPAAPLTTVRGLRRWRAARSTAECRASRPPRAHPRSPRP